MHITVMLRSDAFHHGQARGMAHSPSPLDVFRKAQDAVVRKVRHDKLLLPVLPECVAKLENSEID